MIRYLVELSSRNRASVIGLVLITALVGGWNVFKLPLDALPDTGDRQVIVAGGPGKHSCWMPTFGGDTAPVMRKLDR